ncbi:MAG: hypothetical protein ACJ0Q6_04195 [Candidatus Azotimanducaceae bacterium]|uniref:Uncharacterized protein n=1 Tax=OM182 bacterium TaxID=2510334 RepID=A0A520S1X0_9GAMM|nr:hypothetical protein [Gammaproteobacteria bacterium]OUV67033.1 MAG: hypothetical protein CBC93_06940 [Gammaproteobacteria bacterium TMED133]RZO76467.1 MAG: hypothetical protein EVA68_04075 [OM182 bacterium]
MNRSSLFVISSRAIVFPVLVFLQILSVIADEGGFPKAWFEPSKTSSELGISKVSQNPMLSGLGLPAVEVRHGKNPLVVFPLADIGLYGGMLNVLEDLQEELGLTYLFVAHDLSLVHHICDHILVILHVCIVKQGPLDSSFSDPKEDYTKLLLSAIPSSDSEIPLDPKGRKLMRL